MNQKMGGEILSQYFCPGNKLSKGFYIGFMIYTFINECTWTLRAIYKGKDKYIECAFKINIVHEPLKFPY